MLIRPVTGFDAEDIKLFPADSSDNVDPDGATLSACSTRC